MNTPKTLNSPGTIREISESIQPSVLTILNIGIIVT